MLNLQQAEAVLDTVRSFVDMRAFAQDKSQGIAVPTSAGADRFLSSRRVLDWEPSPVTAGVITLDAGSGSVHSLPADEFIIVNEGSLTLTQQGTTLTLRAKQSAMIQQGAAFTWSAEGPVSLIFVRYNKSQPGDGAIVPIKESPEMGPSAGGPAADLLLTPKPVCRNYTDYKTADGEFTCGTWDSTPYTRRALYFRHMELMHLLEGTVTFVDEAGRSGTFSKGDIFLIEQKASCTWESLVNVAKVYVIYRPA
ncbi:putative cupin superfamily protein [Hydrogenophaga palleronii]|uniref:Cupin superfamily protein n=1 Tax=Hydrogenophaga palleronii TaxID=65655 RepID=A0ABU1WRB7_9BURK|nr:cupin domain-containing protein [Hydrogenophaga palleronii]MDR7151845.1 putative cupin superfamily protein [Hydrogenophaga palleronii]